MRKHLKALSVKLPWAWLMFQVDRPDIIVKDIENRSYATSWRGTIAIQASKKFTAEDVYSAQDFIYSRSVGAIELPSRKDLEQYAGRIIGTVDIMDCIHGEDLTILSPWFVGPYGWVLKNPLNLGTPIPCRGRIDPILWDVPADVLLEINKQLGGKL